MCQQVLNWGARMTALRARLDERVERQEESLLEERSLPSDASREYSSRPGGIGVKGARTLMTRRGRRGRNNAGRLGRREGRREDNHGLLGGYRTRGFNPPRIPITAVRVGTGRLKGKRRKQRWKLCTE